jgi:Tfp pilus assembly protein PilN
VIRINLLQEKKKGKRRRRLAAGEVSSNKQLLLGLGVIAAIGVAVFFVLHLPLEAALGDLKAENARRQKLVTTLTEETKEFDAVKAQVNAASAQEAGILRLQSVRATPAWMLAELSSLLTKDHKPTMSLAMTERIKINSLDEREGTLRIEGGAVSTSDVTQLTLRLQASVYFDGVEAVQVASAVDTASKQAFYRFTIAGKVLY